MSFQLVITEKPSVARSIAAVIGATEKQTGYWQGGGYLVSWCIGHLVSFAEAGQYDEKYCKWKYEDLPILPQPWQFIVPDEKKQQFEIVRALLKAHELVHVLALSREHDDRHVRELPDLLAGLQAVHVRHHEVQHNQVRLLVARQVDGLLPVRAGDDRVALVFQVEANALNEQFFIVDN